MVEDSRIEYKYGFTDSIAKTVVAFSNSGGGSVFLGIDDSGNVVGLDNADEIARRCVQMIHDDVRPDVTNTSMVDVIRLEGKNLVSIMVADGPRKPYYLRSKGFRAEGVYLRQGPASVPVTEEQFNTIVRNVRSQTFESVNSLIQNLTFTYAENVFQKAGLPFDDVHKKQLGLMDAAGFTNLGYLLSDQCEFEIKAAAFNDDGRSGFTDRQEIRGSLLKQFDDAYSFIRRQMTVSSEIVGIRRVDHEEYPEQAVREILLNGIIHRDYNSVGNTLISVYEDRLEIASPGTLVEDIPESDLMKGASFPRNRRLSEIFYRLGLVEAYGTGIPRVMRLYADSERKPVFDISRSMFRVTLFSGGTTDFDSIDEDDLFTRVDFEKRYNVSKSTATSIINQMMADNKIVRLGSGKNTVYRYVRRR